MTFNCLKSMATMGNMFVKVRSFSGIAKFIGKVPPNHYTPSREASSLRPFLSSLAQLIQNVSCAISNSTCPHLKIKNVSGTTEDVSIDLTKLEE